jgi:Mg2+-importing ATPase
MTFVFLRVTFNASEKLFHTAWFVESTLTELIVMIILRTHRPVWRSKPGNSLLFSSIIIALLVLFLPFSFLGAFLGFVPIPSYILFFLAVLISIYAAVNEILKRYWWK